jgi:hypothetical protein
MIVASNPNDIGQITDEAVGTFLLDWQILSIIYYF